MCKVLIVALSLASLGALAAMQPAFAAQSCKMVCDQWEVHNEKRRCFSEHRVCTTTPTSVGSRASQPIQQRRLKKLN